MTDKPVHARAGICLHYTGLYGPVMKEHTACDAGVNYKELAGSEAGFFKRLPCTYKNEGAVECSKRCLPTAEQVKAFEEYMEGRFLKMCEARVLCIADNKVHKKNCGEVACPACATGTLKYSIARSNGHVFASCTTEGCLRWME